jgi:hypothetical protein
MILKRQEKDNAIVALYDSSNILGSVYDNTTGDLTLIFKGGREYKYSNVSKSDYMRFELAESQGDIFNTHIKKYPFEKLGVTDISSLITEVDELKVDEQKAIVDGFKLKIDNLVTLYDTNSKSDNVTFVNYLNKLSEAIQVYLTKITNIR